MFDPYAKAVSKNRFEQRLLHQQNDIIDYKKRRAMNQIWFDRKTIHRQLFGIYTRTPSFVPQASSTLDVKTSRYLKTRPRHLGQVRPFVAVIGGGSGENNKNMKNNDFLDDKSMGDLREDLATSTCTSSTKHVVILEDNLETKLEDTGTKIHNRPQTDDHPRSSLKHMASKSAAACRDDLSPSRLQIAVNRNVVSARTAKRITDTRACLATLERLSISANSRRVWKPPRSKDSVLPVLDGGIVNVELRGMKLSACKTFCG